MKKFLIIAAAVGTTVISTFAASPPYLTLTDGGNAASPAEVIFPATAQAQTRIVNVNYASDTNNATLAFSTGGAAYSIVETNQATSSVTNKISSTNGLTASAVLVLKHNGVYYPATLSTWNSSTNAGFYGGTNVVLASGGWGVATSVGDTVYQMDTPVTIPVGATTNALNGEAVYVSTIPGRPVRVVLSPTLATNKLNSVIGRQE